ARRAVGGDVGPGEGVYSLLRSADDEQLARNVVGEQQQDLRLYRIGVLELVDEDPRELLPQVHPHVGVGRDQIARPHQQIREVERARKALQILVPRGRACQFLVETGGEIRVGVLAELLQVGEERVARGKDL